MNRSFCLASTFVLAVASLVAAQDEETPEHDDPRGDFLRERVELMELRVELHEGLAELAEQEGKARAHQVESEFEATKGRFELTRARVVQSERELERAQRLFETGSAGQADLDEVRDRVLQVKQEHRELEGRLEAFEAEIHATRVRARRAALEARLGMVDAKLQAAEARYELREHEQIRNFPLPDFPIDPDGPPPLPPFDADPNGFDPAIPLPGEEPIDPDADVDVEAGFGAVPSERRPRPNFDAGGGNRDFSRRNEPFRPLERPDPLRRD